MSKLMDADDKLTWPQVVGSLCMGQIDPIPSMKLHGFVCKHVPIVRVSKQRVAIDMRTGQVIHVGDIETVEIPLESHAVFMSKN